MYIAWAPCRNILLNKFDYHIAYVNQKTNIMNGHIDPAFLHPCTKTQPTAIHTSHVTAKLSQKQICPSDWVNKHICQIFDILIWKMYMHIWATHEVTTINHVAMGTVHIFYISLNKYGCHIEQICSHALLLQCTYRPHSNTHIILTFHLWYKQLQSNGHNVKK